MFTFPTPFPYIGLGSGIRDPGSEIRDPGSGIRDPGSGIRDEQIPGSGIRDKTSRIRNTDRYRIVLNIYKFYHIPVPFF
jgi:hypothetical protein